MLFYGVDLEYKYFPVLNDIYENFCMSEDKSLKEKYVQDVCNHILELRKKLKSKDLFITLDYKEGKENIFIGFFIKSMRIRHFEEFKTDLEVIGDCLNISSIEREKYYLHYYVED